MEHGSLIRTICLLPEENQWHCYYGRGVLLRHMGWTEAADLIIKGMEGAIEAKTVTYDFERLMDGAKLLKCSEFGDAIIKHM